jgi:hypothetical protein
VYENELDQLIKFSRRKPHDEKVTKVKSFSPVKMFFPTGPTQRVIVKAHYTTPDKITGHTRYLARDGAGINGEKPSFYTANDREVNLQSIENEQRFFKFIVSPEHGKDINYLSEYTKAVMKNVEKSLGKELQWMATNHHNTDNPHVHVVVRGIDAEGKDLKIEKDFMKYEFRSIARDRATMELGFRSQLEIMQVKEKDITAERFTGIDMSIIQKSDKSKYSQFFLVKGISNTEHLRLEYLSRLGFAQPVNNRGNAYLVNDNLYDKLRDLSYKNDIIKSMHRDLKSSKEDIKPGTQLFIYENTSNISGKIVSKGIEDELTDKPYVMIKTDTDKFYYASGYQFQYSRTGQQIDLQAGEVKKKTQQQPQGIPRRSEGETLDL